jgi:hypothetical protein
MAMLVQFAQVVMNASIRFYWWATGHALITVVSGEIEQWYERNDMPTPVQVFALVQQEMMERAR